MPSRHRVKDLRGKLEYGTRAGTHRSCSQVGRMSESLPREHQHWAFVVGEAVIKVLERTLDSGVDNQRAITRRSRRSSVKKGCLEF